MVTYSKRKLAMNAYQQQHDTSLKVNITRCRELHVISHKIKAGPVIINKFKGIVMCLSFYHLDFLDEIFIFIQ